MCSIASVSTKPEDLAAGGDVLLHAILELATQKQGTYHPPGK
jgi:hypothetical protein